MVGADLTRRVVMANVVKVGLRQRHVHHSENQDADSQCSCASRWSAPCRHGHASFTKDAPAAPIRI